MVTVQRWISQAYYSVANWIFKLWIFHHQFGAYCDVLLVEGYSVCWTMRERNKEIIFLLAMDIMWPLSMACEVE